MTKKEYVAEIQRLLDEEYGDAECSLDYENPLQLLIATQLATQCTDARVNVVMKDLVKKYPTVEAYANADLDELMEDIRSTGFFRNKARNIIGTCQKLISDYGGQVPEAMEDLLSLPGVGRKIANLIRGDVFGLPGVVVDTHAGRLARRMGLTKQTDPYKVEMDLVKIIPPEKQSHMCHQLVEHGRKYCKAQRPLCGECPLSKICKKVL
jgi:endonuclease-3